MSLMSDAERADIGQANERDVDRPEEESLEGEIVGSGDESSRRVRLAAEFRGPLPPPNLLQGYEDVQPGLAAKIISQWEAETEHRHQVVNYASETDRLAMQAFFKTERRGQYVGLAGLGLVASVAVVAILAGETALGGLALVLGAGPAAVWALRRDSQGGDQPVPTDLSDPEGTRDATDRSGS